MRLQTLISQWESHERIDRPSLFQSSHRLRVVHPQDAVPQEQGQEEAPQRQHHAAAVLLLCGGESRRSRPGP